MTCSVKLNKVTKVTKGNFKSIKGKQDGNDWAVQINVSDEQYDSVVDGANVTFETVVVIPKVHNSRPWLQMFAPKGTSVEIN